MKKTIICFTKCLFCCYCCCFGWHEIIAAEPDSTHFISKSNHIPYWPLEIHTLTYIWWLFFLCSNALLCLLLYFVWIARARHFQMIDLQIEATAQREDADFYFKESQDMVTVIRKMLEAGKLCITFCCCFVYKSFLSSVFFPFCVMDALNKIWPRKCEISARKMIRTRTYTRNSSTISHICFLLSISPFHSLCLYVYLCWLIPDLYLLSAFSMRTRDSWQLEWFCL